MEDRPRVKPTALSTEARDRRSRLLRKARKLKSEGRLDEMRFLLSRLDADSDSDSNNDTLASSGSEGGGGGGGGGARRPARKAAAKPKGKAAGGAGAASPGRSLASMVGVKRVARPKLADSEEDELARGAAAVEDDEDAVAALFNTSAVSAGKEKAAGKAAAKPARVTPQSKRPRTAADKSSSRRPAAGARSDRDDSDAEYVPPARHPRAVKTAGGVDEDELDAAAVEAADDVTRLDDLQADVTAAGARLRNAHEQVARLETELDGLLVSATPAGRR
jgi:hypothetical protein